MRKSNSVRLYEGFYISFNGATSFSITPGTLGHIGLKDGGIIEVEGVTPFEMYDAHIDFAYCTNNEITIYNNKFSIEEISAIVAENGNRLLTEDSNNFLVTEYRS